MDFTYLRHDTASSSVSYAPMQMKVCVTPVAGPMVTGPAKTSPNLPDPFAAATTTLCASTTGGAMR
ncbi:hypothetical protein [Ornithinimicrobium kibberense]|uniref:hypothetical protein n=1 Tax=Ornithinimicrobium kibberense TaxID=282060 RepID=UPI00361C25A1